MGRRLLLLLITLGGLLLASLGAPATAARQQGDDRVTPDNRPGSYSKLDGSGDAAHAFCATSRRQQAEPAVAVNPRNPRVIVAGAIDQCFGGERAFPIANAQGWLGLYRSTDSGQSWGASLLPGYPGDPTAELPSTSCGQVDSTMAFDREGRLFYGALCPEFGNQAPLDFHIVVSTFDRDGSRYIGTVGVNADADGAPDLTSAADKPNLAVDITGGRHDGTVYVAYSVCPRIVLDQGPGSIAPCSGLEGRVEVARSTDHGQSFAPPVTIGSGSALGRSNFTDVAIGPDGSIYVTATGMAVDGRSSDVLLSRSVDGGASFSPFTRVAGVNPFNSAQSAGVNTGAAASEDSQSQSLPCGDGAFACESGFTFSPIRTLSAVAADASGVHLVWSARLPSGQAKVFVQSSPDGLRWPHPPVVVDTTPKGHQWYPDIAAADGVIHVVFYDSRSDRAYAPNRPPGNTADGKSSGPSVDTYEARSSNGGRTWTGRRLSTVSQQPGLETQLGARAPWLGDYLYVSAVPGGSYAVWADARDVVPGKDTRGGTPDGFDVSAPCQWFPATEEIGAGYPFASPTTRDACLSQGGLDLNVYGASLVGRSTTKPRKPVREPVVQDGCGRAIVCE